MTTPKVSAPAMTGETVTAKRETTVFWCSRCKERHAGECPKMDNPGAAFGPIQAWSVQSCPNLFDLVRP